MAKPCEIVQKVFQKHVWERYIPLTAYFVNSKMYAGQLQSQHCQSVMQTFQQFHKYFMKQLIMQAQVARVDNQFRKPTNKGLVEFIPIPKQVSYNQSKQVSTAESQTICIHSLQLLSDDADISYFCLEDIQTTCSTYMEDNNLSFLEDSYMV